MKAPDSAAVADSLARLKAAAAVADSAAAAQVVAVPEPPQEKRSFFRRAASKAKQASEKMESVTGISAKDAALAATGVGAAGIVARKMGVDPSAAIGNAIGSATQKSAMNGAASMVPGIPGAPAGGSTGAAMQSMQSMQGLRATSAMQQLAVPNMAQAAAMVGGEDAQVMMQFQQEMIQVTMAATSGDVSARAKLDAWQKMSDKFEVDASALTAAAAGGDAAGYVKLQRMQTQVMRDWLKKYARKPVGAKP
ncbi:MAG: hypothetical protein ABI311_14755 [Gemmatimonadaceae bacterium]